MAQSIFVPFISKHPLHMKPLTLLIIILLFIVNANAQSIYAIQKSDMDIKGTSTLHDWELKATTVKGMCEMSCEGQMIKEIKSFYLEIPTTSLKSVNGSKTMEDKVYSALKSETSKSIIFKLGRIISMKPEENGWSV